MDDVAIRVEGLGKRYELGAVRRRDDTLREALVEGARRAARALAPGRKPRPETLWALRDVSFEVPRGHTMGIIGGNGAGKSTLLKILSRITAPTTGEAVIRGRVGSLLEVGTGFHPELTGRENVFLNGAVLGMRRAEIRARFDEIVAFAEVERFIDTPVKRYSSGMYLRLAFAVAAHLEPEILIVDEVLAVGDAEFQKRCLGKMESVAREGRTVLFVSHDLGAIRLLCTRGILLHRGTVGMDGAAEEVVDTYLRRLERAADPDLLRRPDREGTGAALLSRAEVSAPGSGSGPVVAGGPVRFVFHATRMLPGLACSFTIYDLLGRPITAFDSSVRSPDDSLDASAGATFTCEVDQLLLVPGRYRINAALSRGRELLDRVEAAVVVEVDPGMVGGRPVSQRRRAHVVMPHRWSTPG